MSSFKCYIRRKSQSFPKSLKKYTTSELGVELSTFVPCERRWSWYRMTHCHFARWKTLVVVPYDILPCEIHWLCYRMAHCHAALVVVPYGALSCGTGCGTVWHIARWKALAVVPHSILSGERHWLWYRIRHCQVKYTGCGTAWHIARLHWSWYA